jgi:hypothetical protein
MPTVPWMIVRAPGAAACVIPAQSSVGRPNAPGWLEWTGRTVVREPPARGMPGSRGPNSCNRIETFWPVRSSALRNKVTQVRIAGPSSGMSSRRRIDARGEGYCVLVHGFFETGSSYSENGRRPGS